MTSTLPNGAQASTPSQTPLTEAGALEAPTVGDLMRPLEPTIEADIPLRQAAEMIAQSDDAYAVVELEAGVHGVLTAEDVISAVQTDPTGWQSQRCTSVIPSGQIGLPPHHSVAEVLAEYRARGIRTLLVRQSETAEGVLRPVDVRKWCHEHDPLLWDDLFSQQEIDDAFPSEAGTR